MKHHANKKPPAITTTTGARYRKETISEHIQTKYHTECCQASRLKSLKDVSAEPASMGALISKANAKLADHVGKLLIQVYIDAKKLVLSAYSWPSRYIANEAGFDFKFNSNSNPSIIPPNINMQYVNLPAHLDFLTVISNSDHKNFKKKIEDCIAISLRIDGSVDRTRLDKIYIMAKIINLNGSLELLFLGISIQTQRKAAGLMEAVNKGLESILGDPLILYRKISSICTDGTNLNIGEKSSLWQLLEETVKNSGSLIPLIKIWCCAHRADLVWNDVTKLIKVIHKMLSVLSSIASHFHYSGLRTAELKQIAVENNLELRSLPKLFEVRWTEFTFDLIAAVLTSWNALILYFIANKKNAQCSGLLTYLTKYENLRMISFIGDILFCFKRFQKSIQSEKLTVISLNTCVKNVINVITELKTSQAPNGFEQILSQSIEKKQQKIFLKKIELVTENRRENSTDEIKIKAIDAIVKNLTIRFSSEENFVETIKPFVELDPNANVSAVHKIIALDLCLTSLSMQFIEISKGDQVAECRGMSLNDFIKRLTKSEEVFCNYKELVIVLARINACTPNSADVERCISSNNLMKTNLRSSLSIETELKYLYIHFNMPVLEQWNPRPAITSWINEKKRRERQITTNPETDRTKFREQRYFKGVFSEAHQRQELSADTTSFPTFRF